MWLILVNRRAAVSCGPVTARLGGAGFGFWLTGKLCRAWFGAWVVVPGFLHGVVVVYDTTWMVGLLDW